MASLASLPTQVGPPPGAGGVEPLERSLSLVVGLVGVPVSVVGVPGV